MVAAECTLCAWADPHLSQCLKQRGSGRQEGQLRQDRARYSRSVPLSPLMDVYFCTADESPPVCVSAESRGGEAFEVLVKSMGLEVGAGGALSDEASPPYGGSPTGGASPPGTPTITQMVKNTHMAEEVKRGAFTTPFRLPFGKLKADGSSKDDSFKSVDNPASREEGDEEGDGGDERVRGDGKREKKHKRDKSGGGHALSKLMQVCVCVYVCVFLLFSIHSFLSHSLFRAFPPSFPPSLFLPLLPLPLLHNVHVVPSPTAHTPHPLQGLLHLKPTGGKAEAGPSFGVSSGAGAGFSGEDNAGGPNQGLHILNFRTNSSPSLLVGVQPNTARKPQQQQQQQQKQKQQQQQQQYQPPLFAKHHSSEELTSMGGLWSKSQPPMNPPDEEASTR